jgi:N-acetylneuraminic acid mutarotase
MKLRADRSIRALVRGTGLVALAAVAACRGETSTAPQTPIVTTTFQGVLAGPGGESGVITLTTVTGAASAVSVQSVGPAAASGPGTANLNGTVAIVGGGTHTLTGTFDAGTGGITASGGGYTFMGSVSGSNVSGSYTGPNGAGTFRGLSSSASTPTFVTYCGTFSGPRGPQGVWNLERSGSLLFGVVVDYSPGPGPNAPPKTVTLTGQVTGTSVSLTASDLNGNAVGSATGTITQTEGSGTWASSISSESGTWSASTAACAPQPTAVEFTIAPNFVGQSAAFDGTNYLVGIQDQTVRNTNKPGVFAQFVSSTGALAGPVLGPLGPSGNVQGDPPCVGFGTSNYLVAWAGNFSQTGGDVLGQLVPTGGSPLTVGFPITATHDASSTGGVVFGGGKYLVAYERMAGSLHKVYGRLVSPDGTVGSELPISSGFGQVHLDVCHQVAFDGTNFLVVWIEESADATLNNTVIKGRFVSASGVLGNEFTITQGVPSFTVGVAYDGVTYFVVWNAVVDPATYHYDVFGQLVTGAGALSGGVISIATGSAFQFGHVSAAGSNFLVVWDYFQSSVASAAIKAKIFDGSGTLIGAERTLFTRAADGRVPALGAEVFNGRDYFVVFGRATAPANPFDFEAYTNWSVDGAFITPWGGATLPPVACNCWTTKRSMPTARAGFGAAAVNGLLYAVGGDNGTTVLATLEVYDPSTDTWTTKAPMPTARTGLSAAAVNGILYAVGGSPTIGTYTPGTTVEAYDPASNTWTSKASIPTTLFVGGVAAVNDILYRVGGGGSLTSGFVATVEAYDPAIDTWTTKAAMPTARLGLDVVATNGVLYAVGGFDGNNALATVEAYDPSTNTWVTKAAMPTARQGPKVAAINGLLYVAGGVNNTGVLATLEAYDPSTNTWTTKASMPTARLGLGVAAINGLLYAAAGFRFGANSSGEWLATLEAYQP